MTLQEQAWQSGLVLLDEKWNETDLPPLEGGWRFNHASVVLNHPDQDGNDNKDNAQTVVVVGGVNKDWRSTNSVLVLNLAESNQQWREGPPLNKRRRGPAAVVCNGGVYVMGGGNGPSSWNCIERIDASGLLQSASTLNSSQQKIHWVTLNSPLSTGRIECCAIAVHNRYIVVVGGWSVQEVSVFSSVDIIDTNNHIVTAGPSMNFPRINFASAVIGHRIFVAGCSTRVEYLDFANHCDNDEPKKETTSTVISFSSTWTTHSDLVLSDARDDCGAFAVGSCLVVAGGEDNPTVEVLDTHRNRVWNLPPFASPRRDCSIVTLANQIAVIGGLRNPTCATLPLLDKNTWCFRRLCEQQPNGWYHLIEEMTIRNTRPCSTPSDVSITNMRHVQWKTLFTIMAAFHAMIVYVLVFVFLGGNAGLRNPYEDDNEVCSGL